MKKKFQLLILSLLTAFGARAQVAVSDGYNDASTLYDFSNAETVTSDPVTGVGYVARNSGTYYHFGPATATLTNNGLYNAYDPANNGFTGTPATPGIDWFQGLDGQQSTDQQIAGSVAPRFGILNLDNGSLQFFNITNSNGAEVGKTANFTNGITTTVRANSSTGALRFLSGATYTRDNASDAQYVNGYVGKIGNQAFTFPVGDQFSGDSRTLAISAPATATTHLSIAYWKGDPGTNLDPTGGAHPRTSLNTTPLNGEVLASVSPLGFWDWIPVTGTDNMTITVSLQLQSAAIPGSYLVPANQRLVGWNTANSQWELLGNTGNTTLTEGSTLSGTTNAYAGRTMASYSAIGWGSIAGFCLYSRAYLEGSLMNNGSAVASDGRPLMRDNLRNSPYTGANYIPSANPYTTPATYVNVTSKYANIAPGNLGKYATVTSPSVFTVTGQNAIVDWAYVELRDKTNSANVLAARAGLIQRDGDIVDVDGVGCLYFDNVKLDNYYVAVRHRSHLGAMTAAAQTPTQMQTLVNFTVPTTAMYDFGTTKNASNYAGLAEHDGVVGTYRALWAGDADANRKVRYQAPVDDAGIVQTDVLFYSNNTAFDDYYDFAYGYFQGDFDMNSKARYQAPGDDAGLIQTQVLFYPLNTAFDDYYDFMLEQLP